MYRWESWTIKKAKCGRIDAFRLWCWRRLLRVPWTARRSNQSILKEINPEYLLEGLMLKLKLLYFGHLMRKFVSLEKTLMLGGGLGAGEGNDRGWDGWMASSTRCTRVLVNSRSWCWIWCAAIHWQRVGRGWVTELYWTDVSILFSALKCKEKKRND